MPGAQGFLFILLFRATAAVLTGRAGSGSVLYRITVGNHSNTFALLACLVASQ